VLHEGADGRSRGALRPVALAYRPEGRVVGRIRFSHVRPAIAASLALQPWTSAAGSMAGTVSCPSVQAWITVEGPSLPVGCVPRPRGR